MALAITSLGWPTGSLVLLPASPEQAAGALTSGLDRLRWLFAGNQEVRVLNLEPSAAAALDAAVAPAEDRALVARLVQPDEDPAAILTEAPLRSQPALARLRPSRAGLVSRYPIVFCHGMLGYSLLRMQLPKDRNGFWPLRQFLRERGFRVLFPQVAPTSGVPERAEQLRDQIVRWTHEPVNLIAHSMGGLDARHMITHLGMADRVRSLTTVCSPHRGSYLADWFLANYRTRVPLLLALEAFGVNLDGFQACRPSVCRDFNASTPDVPGVQYFSYGGKVSAARLTPVLRRAWNLLLAAEGPNDCMVSVQSATWGQYLGNICADHFAQTPDGMYVRQNEDFDALGFFTRLVEDLARRGF